MLEQTPHQTNAVAQEETTCVSVDRHDILVLLQKKPHAGMDMLAVLGRQFHSAQQLVRKRAARNPNEMIESKATFGETIADAVASAEMLLSAGFPLVVPGEVPVTRAPTDEELGLIRERLDPAGARERELP